MRLSESSTPSWHLSHYDHDSVTINQQRYTHSVVLNKAGVSAWDITQLSNLNEEIITSWAALKPDIIVLGTGRLFKRPPQTVLDTCAIHEIGLEFMNTASACRCLNILLEEKRNVTAALLIGDKS